MSNLIFYVVTLFKALTYTSFVKRSIVVVDLSATVKFLKRYDNGKT